jgi:predicted outer membrane repeat protein
MHSPHCCAVCLPCVLRSATIISGGAIYSFSGDNVTVIGSDLSNNHAYFGGGAIYVEKATRLTLFRTNMSGNTAGESPERYCTCYTTVVQQVTGCMLQQL